MANITLNYDGKTLEFPLTVGSEKEGGIDIAKLRSGTGLVTLDPGFLNTASTTSAITFLDGEKGILRYRGYPIEQLAEKSTFIEVAYLLLYGELPSASQLAAFQATIAAQSLVPEDLKHLYRAFPRTRTRWRCWARRSTRSRPSTTTPTTPTSPRRSSSPRTASSRSSRCSPPGATSTRRTSPSSTPTRRWATPPTS
jgi:citrate synthase